MLGVELAPDRWVRRYRIEGLPVIRAYPDLPAAKAGITSAYRGSRGEIILGDVITHIDDKPVRSHDDYYGLLETYEAGDEVTVTSRLGDKVVTYKVKLVESQ